MNPTSSVISQMFVTGIIGLMIGYICACFFHAYDLDPNDDDNVIAIQM